MSDLKAVEDLGLFGERLCLDFTNTAGAHPIVPGRNFLTSYDHLLMWAQYEKLLSADMSAHLMTLAAENPNRAESALQQAVEIRETIYRILSAEADGRSPDAGDMAVFNQALLTGLPQMELMKSESGHYGWQWIGDSDDLVGILSPVVWDAADLMQSDTLHQVRECAGDDCNWLFLDTSRNHSRRWCDMKSCGNRAKVRSHYYRTHQTD